jgi:hypothetical protein
MRRRRVFEFFEIELLEELAVKFGCSVHESQGKKTDVLTGFINGATQRSLLAPARSRPL